MDALFMVCSVMEEADIEVAPLQGSSLRLLCQRTWDEWGRPWGRERDVTQADLQENWEKRLGATAAGVWTSP